MAAPISGRFIRRKSIKSEGAHAKCSHFVGTGKVELQWEGQFTTFRSRETRYAEPGR